MKNLNNPKFWAKLLLSILLLIGVLFLYRCGPSREEMEQQQQEQQKQQTFVSQYAKVLESTNDYQVILLTYEGKEFLVYETRQGLTSIPLQ